MSASVVPEYSQTEDGKALRFALQHGRTLSVSAADTSHLVEIHAESGMLELRIRVTDQGPVLEVNSIRISLRAAESVNVECKEFNVKAEQSVDLQSQGEFKVSGEADVRVDAKGEVHVKGTMIYLN